MLHQSPDWLSGYKVGENTDDAYNVISASFTEVPVLSLLIAQLKYVFKELILCPQHQHQCHVSFFLLP